MQSAAQAPRSFTTARSERPPLPKPKLPRIVAVGGGTGLPIVLRGFADALQTMLGPRDLTRWADYLTAIVTVTDDGGSSGRLRRELGMPPPGDIRNCLAALSSSIAFEQLLQHRFETKSDLDGHSVGNLMLAALAQMTGNFATAVDQLATLLRARGHVYPSTAEDVTLRAELSSGDLVEGETAIVRHPARIRRLGLAREVRPLPEALRAIINADIIIVGPGSLYTSVLPNLLVGGVASTLSAVHGIRVYVANLMTEPGETDGLSLDDHLRVLKEHTRRDLFDFVLVNTTPPTSQQMTNYRDLGADVISCEGHLAAGSARIVTADLLDTAGDQVRHDSGKLAKAILELAHGVMTAGCGRPVGRVDAI